MLGCTFIPPARMRRTYWGRRKMPWPSDPRRSARIISRATCSASDTGSPTAVSARPTNASRSLDLNRRSGGGVWVIRQVCSGQLSFPFESKVPDVQAVQIASLRSIPFLHPPPRRGGGKRWGLEPLERFERLERSRPLVPFWWQGTHQITAGKMCDGFAGLREGSRHIGTGIDP